jgi:hypothetical protein
MPKGPKGEKRPADVIGAAIKVAKIATGEIEEDSKSEDGKTYRGWWADVGRIGITVSYMGSDARFGSRTAQPIGHNADRRSP